ncbi:MAG: hypothetical protein C5B48_05590 [Candidatus Rokuibacteriota bacterium]|nr:MAG: hypothetical protein C5B48_05590 [Candidatus Rokubacteria bacterium]
MGYRTAVRQVNKRLLHRDQTFTLPTGLTMTLPFGSCFGNEVFVTGANVDNGAETLLAGFADLDADAVDVSANIGYYSLYLAPAVRKVYAFEPNPRSVSVLRRNAAPNVVFEEAVSDRVGTGSPRPWSGSEVSRISGQPRSTTVEVSATTIDAFIARRPDVCVRNPEDRC